MVSVMTTRSLSPNLSIVWSVYDLGSNLDINFDSVNLWDDLRITTLWLGYDENRKVKKKKATLHFSNIHFINQEKKMTKSIKNCFSLYLEKRNQNNLSSNNYWFVTNHIFFLSFSFSIFKNKNYFLFSELQFEYVLT